MLLFSWRVKSCTEYTQFSILQSHARSHARPRQMCIGDYYTRFTGDSLKHTIVVVENIELFAYRLVLKCYVSDRLRIFLSRIARFAITMTKAYSMAFDTGFFFSTQVYVLARHHPTGMGNFVVLIDLPFILQFGQTLSHALYYHLHAHARGQ